MSEATSAPSLSVTRTTRFNDADCYPRQAHAIEEGTGRMSEPGSYQPGWSPKSDVVGSPIKVGCNSLTNVPVDYDIFPHMYTVFLSLFRLFPFCACVNMVKISHTHLHPISHFQTSSVVLSISLDYLLTFSLTYTHNHRISWVRHHTSALDSCASVLTKRCHCPSAPAGISHSNPEHNSSSVSHSSSSVSTHISSCSLILSPSPKVSCYSP